MTEDIEKDIAADTCIPEGKYFTIRYGGKVRNLTTPCGVTLPGLSPLSPSVFGSCIAVWDTGCSVTTVSRRLLADLKSKAIDKCTVNTIAGTVVREYHEVDVVLPDGIALHRLKVMSGDMDRCDVLVGMDVISMGDFAVSNMSGETVMSFRVPPAAAIDFTRRR